MDNEYGHSSCDSCRTVVARVYRELRELGTDDPSAFKSAVTVLALRHPGNVRREYLSVVADWLADDPEAANGV